MPDLQRVTRDASSRRFARGWGWLRRHASLAIALAGVLGALTATVVVVSTGAAGKDRLRQAQIALVQVPAALFGMVQSPQALLAGERVASSEFPLSRSLRERLVAMTVTTVRFWSTPLTRRVQAEARRIESDTAQLMTLIGERRLRSANALENRAIGPDAQVLGTDVAAATKALTREIAHKDQTSWVLTVIVVGLAGTLLLALVCAVALARGRNERDRIERERTAIESRSLRESRERLQALVEHGSDIITVVRTDARVVYQVGPVEAILGYRREMPEGAKLTDWVAPPDLSALLDLCGTEHAERHELRMLHRDGRNVTCEVSATSLLGHPVWGDAVVLNMWDVTGRKVLEERLRHQAFHDQLTQLPNRACVLDAADRMLARARPEQTSVIALFIDLDGFKKTNDTFGHAAGDELLTLVGSRLSRITRKGDLVGRLGGDEFIMLVDGFTLDVAPEIMAERVLAALREPVVLDNADGPPLHINASMGIAAAQGGTADELLRDADLALYEAKNAGKNRYVVSSPPPHPDLSPQRRRIVPRAAVLDHS